MSSLVAGLLASCFLLDVHSKFYFEQPAVAAAGLDYSAPESLPIPLSAATKDLWEAPDAGSWNDLLRPEENMTAISNTILERLSGTYLSGLPPFDSAIILGACVLQLPQRAKMKKVNLIEDASEVSIGDVRMAQQFPDSGISYTYLALHHTPLHTLLSVSGDSWVLNKKVTQVNSFSEHQQQLEKWQKSGSACIAVAFATRALRCFLELKPPDADGEDGEMGSLFWKDISDYWGVYVCALICWAFGHRGKWRGGVSATSRRLAVEWILATADLEPAKIQELNQRQEALGVVGLAMTVLARDCQGGRNILFADSVRVLKKLGEGDNWSWF